VSSFLINVSSYLAKLSVASLACLVAWPKWPVAP
jgi:hypothetical protein